MNMTDTLKFPNGYDVVVCRRDDIMECIDENIIDKELVLEVINNCELNASKFISEGRWTGIPFLGNIKVPDTQKILLQEDTKEIIDYAKESLSKEKYILFRQELHNDIRETTKEKRFANWKLSLFLSKNKSFYKLMQLRYKSESIAKFVCYTCIELNEVNRAWEQD